MAVYCQDFTFNGKTLSSFDPDLVVVSFTDSRYNSDVTVVNRSVQRSEITYDDALTYDYGVLDNDVYRFTITLANEHADYLSQDLVRKLTSWLISPTEPKWLEFTRYPNPEGRAKDPVYLDVQFKGRFIRTSMDDIGGVNKVGITFEFENISPYGFTKQYAWEVDSTLETQTATLSTPGTDIGKLVTPVVLIESHTSTQDGLIDHETGTQYIDAEDTEALNLEYNDEAEGQTISIQNLDANTAPFIIKIPQGTTVALIGDNCYYYNGDQSFNTSNMELYSFSNLQNFNWPRMVSGTNRIRCSGDAKITFVARFYEALGV